ncbi:MAG: hypothetical protein MUC42_13615 [Bryobacter sp.]|nr:hypothetical protein [Bryobacter sp.]
MRAVSLLLMLALGAAALQDEKPSPIVSKKRKATEKHEAPTKPVPDAGTAAPPVEKKPEPEKKVPCWVDNAASAGAGVGSIGVGVGCGAQAARSKTTKKIYPYFFTI